MTPIVLFAVALAGRVMVGALFGEPAYPDSYYYVNVARELAAGNGFHVDYVWNFADVGGRLPADAQLPMPSNGHWMPLAVLVQVPFIGLLGPTVLASALPFWLIGAAAAPLAYVIGRDAGLERRVALTGGLLTAVSAGVLPFMAQPDNFGLYMTLGALALWLAARTLRGDRRALVLGGAVVGLATLARNDGLLLGVPLALAALIALARSPARQREVLAIGGAAALFVVALGPWLVRQLAVFGSVSPSAASGRILWLSDYGQPWSIGELPMPDGLLAGGIGPLVASRLDGLAWAVATFALLPLAGALVPFALWGARDRWRDSAFTPFFVYAGIGDRAGPQLRRAARRDQRSTRCLPGRLPHRRRAALLHGAASGWRPTGRHGHLPGRRGVRQMKQDRPVGGADATYTRSSMEMGTLGIGRRPDLGALAEAKESVDRAPDDLALAVLEAQERERARLANELHDGPAQALSNLIMQCEIIERQLRSDPALAVEELHRLRQLLRTELEVLRGYIYQLRPPLAQSDDLNTALTEAAERLAESASIAVEFTLDAPPDALERAARSAVLRVAQEALRNVGKHSEARHAWLRSRVEAGARGNPEWILEVADDGRGFDTNEIGQQTRRRHFGLRFMHERSELLGARLAIESNPGAGTVVRLTVNSSGVEDDRHER